MSKSYIFFVDKINEKFPGLSKIIQQIKPVFGDIRVINSLDNENNGTEIIPLGTVAAYFFLKKFRRGGIAFIIDAYTLGFYSVSRFYIKNGEVFNKNLIGAILRYIKYYFIEKKIVSRFDKVVVVSEHDANYLRKKYKCTNIYVVTNGVDITNPIIKENKDFNYTLGILSYWGASAIKDIDWFVSDYLPRLKKIYPQIKLITAGRGANDEIKAYFKRNEIEFLGEIDDLGYFFDKIDIYITTLRKECGILNKVLDAMAHKKIVVGLEYNLYAFQKLSNGFFTYNNFDDLVMVIDKISKDETTVIEKTDNAYRYICENHNWSKNYEGFKIFVDSYYNKR